MRLFVILPFFLISHFTTGQHAPSNEYGSGNENGPLRFYQQFLSPIRGRQACPMYPSCSQYARLNFSRFGPVSAVLNTTDRLLRCGHDLAHYPMVWLANGKYYLDPLTPPTPESIFFAGPLSQDSVCFADFLFSSGDYDLALLEYKRMLYDGSQDAELISCQIATCDYQLGHYGQVVEVYGKMVLSGIQNDRAFNSISLLAAKALLRQQEYAKAIQVARLTQSDSGYLLAGEGLLRIGQIAEASASFMRSDKVDTNPEKLDRIRNLQANYSELKLKKVWLAGSLSAVIPGLGYAYSNKKGTAVASFLVNSIFIWTAAEAFHQKHYGLFTASTLFGLSWYAGNVKGSAEAAIDYNTNKKNKFIESTLKAIYHSP